MKPRASLVYHNLWTSYSVVFSGAETFDKFFAAVDDARSCQFFSNVRGIELLFSARNVYKLKLAQESMSDVQVSSARRLYAITYWPR